MSGDLLLCLVIHFWLMATIIFGHHPSNSANVDLHSRISGSDAKNRTRCHPADIDWPWRQVAEDQHDACQVAIDRFDI